MTASRTSKIQIRLNSTPQAAFAALLDNAALQAWFCEFCDIDLAKKQYNFWGRFTLGNPSRAEGQQEILELDPDKRLKFRWHFEDISSEVTYALHQQEAHTILTVTHDFFEGEKPNETAGSFEDFWFLSLENLRRHLDGKQAKMRCDFSQPLKGDIKISLDINADAETVFDILINPAQMNRWIAHNAKVEPHVGGAYRLGWGDSDTDKIIELEENKKLSISWPADEMYPSSTLTWTLEASSGKTRLTMFHSGFAVDADTDGLHLGWRNFINWVGSIAEYGDEWQSPLRPLTKEIAGYYPVEMSAAQDEVIV